MKSYLTAAIIFSILLLTVPALPLITGQTADLQTDSSITEQVSATENTENNIIGNSSEPEYEMLKILDITTGKVEEISAYDYVVGAVAAEMPATFEHEALKAQAVASYTYAVRQAKKSESVADTDLNGAYFSNDSSRYQTYFTENQIMQYYGENYEEYLKKIKDAVSEVEFEYIVYEDEPIIAAFHSLSTGKTESAENVWGNSIPYLVSVESEYDTKAPDFMEVYEFTHDEMKELLEKSFEGIKLSENPKEWFSDTETTDAGNVLSVKVCNKEITGQQLSKAFSIRSASFEIECEDNFKITVKGCGHCVGMSQYGANEMAKAGKKYDEILKHYYKGIEIIR